MEIEEISFFAAKENASNTYSHNYTEPINNQNILQYLDLNPNPAQLNNFSNQFTSNLNFQSKSNNLDQDKTFGGGQDNFSFRVNHETNENYSFSVNPDNNDNYSFSLNPENNQNLSLSLSRENNQNLSFSKNNNFSYQDNQNYKKHDNHLQNRIIPNIQYDSDQKDLSFLEKNKPQPNSNSNPEQNFYDKNDESILVNRESSDNENSFSFEEDEYGFYFFNEVGEKIYFVPEMENEVDQDNENDGTDSGSDNYDDEGYEEDKVYYLE